MKLVSVELLCNAQYRLVDPVASMPTCQSICPWLGFAYPCVYEYIEYIMIHHGSTIGCGQKRGTTDVHQTNMKLDAAVALTLFRVL